MYKVWTSHTKINSDGKVLNVDGEALKSYLKVLHKGLCGGIKCDEGVLKDDIALLSLKNNKKAINCNGKAFNFNIIHVAEATEGRLKCNGVR